MTPLSRRLLLVLPLAIAIAFGASQVSRAGRDGAQAGRLTTLRHLTDAHPTVTRMRLDLTAEYLRTGAIAEARTEAAIALSSASSAGDHQRAQKYLGWAMTLDGDPEAGATMLEESAAADPQDADARWFLANARLALGDGAGALKLLAALDVRELAPDARRLVARVVEDARRIAGPAVGN